ncbi:cytochrome c [Orrella sp. JC864]|uniref:c-type cytochrome n=1 Tax=Orrella sp. JC864 TaxID=3120298 RepID=UPI0012BBB476
MKKPLLALAAACASAAALFHFPAAAQFAKPDDAIKYRQSAFTLISAHFGRMGPVAKGQAPYDAEQIKANVQLLQTLAALPWGAFGPGTEGGGARAEVWSDEQGFLKAQQRFVQSVDKLAQAAATGELVNVRAAFGDVGASCKACHDSYRQRR